MFSSGPSGKCFTNNNPNTTAIKKKNQLNLNCTEVLNKDETYGAQVLAYPRINKQAETIINVPTALLSIGSLAVPAEAKTNNQRDCQSPPKMRGLRRPNYGIEQIRRLSLGGEMVMRRKTCLFHNEQSQEGASKVHTPQNKLTNEGVGYTDSPENRCAVVKAVGF